METIKAKFKQSIPGKHPERTKSYSLSRNNNKLASRSRSCSFQLGFKEIESSKHGHRCGDLVSWGEDDDTRNIGVVKWIGAVKNSEFVGVEFSTPICDGYPMIQGSILFPCKENYGRLVKSKELKRIMSVDADEFRDHLSEENCIEAERWKCEKLSTSELFQCIVEFMKINCTDACICFEYSENLTEIKNISDKIGYMLQNRPHQSIVEGLSAVSNYCEYIRWLEYNLKSLNRHFLKQQDLSSKREGICSEMLVRLFSLFLKKIENKTIRRCDTLIDHRYEFGISLLRSKSLKATISEKKRYFFSKKFKVRSLFNTHAEISFKSRMKQLENIEKDLIREQVSNLQEIIGILPDAGMSVNLKSSILDLIHEQDVILEEVSVRLADLKASENRYTGFIERVTDLEEWMEEFSYKFEQVDQLDFLKLSKLEDERLEQRKELLDLIELSKQIKLSQFHQTALEDIIIELQERWNLLRKNSYRAQRRLSLSSIMENFEFLGSEHYEN